MGLVDLVISEVAEVMGDVSDKVEPSFDELAEIAKDEALETESAFRPSGEDHSNTVHALLAAAITEVEWPAMADVDLSSSTLVEFSEPTLIAIDRAASSDNECLELIDLEAIGVFEITETAAKRLGSIADVALEPSPRRSDRVWATVRLRFRVCVLWEQEGRAWLPTDLQIDEITIC